MSSSGKQLAERTRRFTSLPLAVGFGISTPAQVQEVQSYADAAVVGSAVVHAIEDHYAQGGAQAIEKLVRQLKNGTEVQSA
jgi:tryptophan synthase alpha chain